MRNPKNLDIHVAHNKIKNVIYEQVLQCDIQFYYKKDCGSSSNKSHIVKNYYENYECFFLLKKHYLINNMNLKINS